MLRSPRCLLSATRHLALGATLVGASLWATPTSAQPGECSEHVIRHIFVDNHSIFNVAEIDSEARFRSLYVLAHKLHRRTRSSFIENELLFRPGDCLDPLLLEESERILRSYSFIAEADIYSVTINETDAHIVVDTQDEWSLEVQIKPAFEEGFRFTHMEVAEKNLLGTGSLIGFFLSERDEQRDLGLTLRTPRLIGTRLDAQVTGGRTRTGSFFTEEVAYPFLGEVGKVAFSESVSRRGDLFSYALPPPTDLAPWLAHPDGRSFTSVSLPFETRRAQATVGWRFGRPGDLTVLGGGISWEETRFDDYPDGVMLVVDNDYAAGEVADPATANALAGQLRATSAARFNMLVGKRNIRFLTRRGLDAIRGAQDIRVGTQALVSGGTTLGAAPQSQELRGAVSLFGGAAGDSWVFNSELIVEGTHLPDKALPESANRTGGLNDLIAGFDASFYWQPGASSASAGDTRTSATGQSSPSRHTLVFGVSAAGGWNNTRPFQLTLGGPNRVRGFGRQEFPVGQRVMVHLEDRVTLDGPFSDLLDLRLAAFLDAGAGWPGDVPFGAASGMRAAAGVGLRLAFPGSRNTLRLDVAVPLEDGGLRRARFWFGLPEAVNLIAGFRDRQLQRSRSARPVNAIFATPPTG